MAKIFCVVLFFLVCLTVHSGAAPQQQRRIGGRVRSTSTTAAPVEFEDVVYYEDPQVEIQPVVQQSSKRRGPAFAAPLSLEERERQVSVKEKSLETRERDFESIKRAYEEREKVLANREAALDTRDIELNERDRDLDKKGQDNDRRLKEREARINERERKLAEKEQTLLKTSQSREQEMEKLGRERETAAVLRESALVEREKSIAERERTVESALLEQQRPRTRTPVANAQPEHIQVQKTIAGHKTGGAQRLRVSRPRSTTAAPAAAPEEYPQYVAVEEQPDGAPVAAPESKRLQSTRRQRVRGSTPAPSS